jgi:aminoglycoside phosphotransferase (APT) family kinase protein
LVTLGEELIPDLVKPVQSRRGKGWSLVFIDEASNWGETTGRVYVKAQSDYKARPSWRLFRLTHRLTNEHHALEYCHQHGIPAPKIVSFRENNEIAELVLEEVADAMDLMAFVNFGNPPETERAVFDQLGRVIKKLHSLGWVHGSLGNDHILIQPDNTVSLIDFEKAHWNPFGVKRDLRRFWKRNPYLRAEHKDWFLASYR